MNKSWGRWWDLIEDSRERSEAAAEFMHASLLLRCTRRWKAWTSRRLEESDRAGDARDLLASMKHKRMMQVID